MKRLLGIGLVAVMAMVGANTALAVYSDAIGIAFQQGNTPLGSTVMAGSYLSQDNWITITGLTGIGNNKDSMSLSSLKSDNGITYATLAGDLSYWHDASHGNDPVGQTSGNITYPPPANFTSAFYTGKKDPSFIIYNIPFLSYDVAILTATLVDDGWYDKIESTKWTLASAAQSASTYNSPAAGDVSSWAIMAIQILSNDTATGTGTGTDVPEPGTVLLLGGSLIGLVGGALRRFARK